MRGVISIYIIQLSIVYFTSKVESLTGQKITKACKGEFPFTASLQYLDEGQHFCTGALITKQHVLTAAHCLTNKQPAEVEIVLGVVDLRNANTTYAVAWWLTYDYWANMLNTQNKSSFNDIAIITLNNNGREPTITPVRLSELNKKQVQGKNAIMIGWKQLANTDLLQKASVKILSNKECERNDRLITNRLMGSYPRLLCTAAVPYVLAQDGDSGGPLLDQNGAILGVNFGDGPHRNFAWGNFSDKFLKNYQINLHFSVDYYRYFIVNITGYH